MNSNKNSFYKIWLLTAILLTVLLKQVAANNELSVTNLAITPQPVLAGQNVTISFQIYDSYGSLTNANLGLVGSYPLVNYSPTGTQLLSSVSPGVYGGVPTYFVYRLSIPPNVQAGTYSVYVYATYQLQSTSGGTTTYSAASSNIPISFYISGVPNIVLSASPTTAIVPGSQFGVTLNALNSGTAQATNATITLLSSGNFTVVGAATFNLGTLQATATTTASAMLQANTTLKPGIRYVPAKLRYTLLNGQNVSKTVNVPVSVVVSSPNLVPSIVSAQPQILYSGSNQTLTVSVQNIGVGVAKNVSIKFLTTPNITVGSSASGVFVGSIQPGSSTTVPVFITANKNDNQTYYSLPVQLVYSNANYQNSVSKTAYLNITLQSTAQFNITSVNDNLAPGSTYKPVSFMVKNTGNQPAQQITFSMQAIYPVVPVNPNLYISNLNPGQTANVTFYVNVDPQGNSGSYPVTLYEQWTQPNGARSQQYTSSSNYYAVVNPGQASQGTASLLPNVIEIVIVVVIVYFVYTKTNLLKNILKQIKMPKQGTGKQR